MKNFTRIVFSLTVLFYVTLATADLLEDIEKHVAKKLGKNIVDQAIRYLEKKEKKGRISIREKDSVGYGLYALSRMNDGNKCYGFWALDDIKRTIELGKRMNPKGNLYQTTVNIFEYYDNKCYRILKRDIEARSKPINEISNLIVSLAENSKRFCNNNTNQTEPYWQYECMKSIKKLEPKQVAPVLVQILKEFVGSRFAELTDKNKGRDYVYVKLLGLYKSYRGACERMNDRIGASGRDSQYPDPTPFDIIQILQTITKREFDPELAALMKKVNGVRDFCVLNVPEFGPQVAEEMTKMIYDQSIVI